MGGQATDKGDSIYSANGTCTITLNGGKVLDQVCVGTGTWNVIKLDAPADFRFLNTNYVKLNLSQIAADCSTIYVDAASTENSLTNAENNASGSITFAAGKSWSDITCLQPYAGYTLSAEGKLVADAASALVAEDGVITLTKDTAANITLEDDLCIDLNGFDLYGKISLGENNLYCMDSATDDFDCSNGYGVFYSRTSGTGNLVNGEQNPFANKMRYVAIPEQDGYSFHRIYVGITDVSVVKDGDSVGLGYTTGFKADEAVTALVTGNEAYGIMIGLSDGNDGMLEGSFKEFGKAANTFVAGNVGNKVTLHVNNILTTDNVTNANVKVRALTYINLDGMDTIYSNAYEFSLQEVLQAMDGKDAALAEENAAAAQLLADIKTLYPSLFN